MERQDHLRQDDIRLRPAHPGDTDAILRMVAGLAAHHGDTATLTGAALRRDAFGDVPWVHVMVAETGGQLVGYAALCGLIQLQYGMRGMDMHHLYVEDGCRGLGVGARLVAACREQAARLGCGYLTVSTAPDNHAAQQFYEAQGFARRQTDVPRFSLQLMPEAG